VTLTSREQLLLGALWLGLAFALGACGGGGSGGGTIPGQPLRLGFVQQPQRIEAGATLAPVEVAVFDSGGQVATGQTLTVTLSLEGAPAGAQLQGTLTRVCVQGVATFSDLVLTRAGSGFSLRAAAASSNSGSSTPFEVLPAAASKLALRTQPGVVASGVALSPGVEVEVQDSFGNRVSSASPQIRAGLLGGAPLAGSSSLLASQGLGVFSNLSVIVPGSYQLEFTAPGLQAATSAVFSVVPLPPGVQPAPPGFVVSSTLLAVNEGGGSATFSLQLNTPTSPKADVSVVLSSTNPGEATVSPSVLTFSSTGPLTPQIVTVTGVDDLFDDGDVDLFVVTSPATSADPAFAGLDPPDVRVTNLDDDAAGIVLSTNALATSETGSSASLTFALRTVPTADVRVGVSSSDPSEGLASVTTLTFTPVNALTPQLVLVTGQDDPVADGDVSFALVTSPAQSADPRYQGLDPSDALVTNTDDDSAGISVTTSTSMTTSEAGGMASFAIVLSSTPTAPVRVDLVSSDPSEGVVTPSFVVFTPGNASIPQVATVRGVDDVASDGVQAYQVRTQPAISADPVYNGLDAGDLGLLNTDDDVAGILVSSNAGLLVGETGDEDSFSISLATIPSAAVTISLAASITSECLLVPSSVTFTPSNALVPQVVRVIGVDDGVSDGTRSLSVLTGSAVSADPAYLGLDPPDVLVTNREWRVASFAGGVGDGGAAIRARLVFPYDVAHDSLGNLYVSDRDGRRVRRIDAATGLITSYAGTGQGGFGGDGGLAVNALLWAPGGLAFDASDNLYVTDGSRIRRIDAATGIISTVAGTGSTASSGDGGPAVNASLSYPSWVTFSPSGDLFIACRGRIRRVFLTTGLIETLAGTGSTSGPLGDGGPANLATVSPNGLCVDSSGDLLFSDFSQRSLRKISLSTGLISTLATVGTPAEGIPAGLARDASDNVLVSFGDRIRRVDGSSQAVTTIAGTGTGAYSGDGGPAAAAQLNDPLGLALNGAGDVLLADSGNRRLRKIAAGSGVISTEAGGFSLGFSGNVGDGGQAKSAFLYRVKGVAHHGGVTYLAEENDRVRRVDAGGVITTYAGGGVGDGALASESFLYQPFAACTDAGGNLLLADAQGGRVRRVDAGTGRISTFAGIGRYALSSGDGGPATSAGIGPRGLALRPSGDLLILETTSQRIRQVDFATGIITTFAGTGLYGSAGDGGPAASAQFQSPAALALDLSGNVFVAESGRIRRIDAATGIVSTVAGDGVNVYGGDAGLATAARLRNPVDLAFDSGGNLLILSSGRVRRIDAATGVITTVVGTGGFGSTGDGGPATSATINASGLELDASDNIYLASSNSVRRVEAATGVISLLAGVGGGSLTTAPVFPRQIYLRGNSLFLFENDVVRRLDLSSGGLTPFAGGGRGDGGPASEAVLTEPRGLAVDASGNLFIADTRDHVVRRVDALSGVITRVAGRIASAGFAGGGAPQASLLNGPRGLCIDSAGALYIADSGNHRVRRIDASLTTITTVCGTGVAGYGGEGQPSQQALLNAPLDVAVNSGGDIFVADAGNDRVRRIDAATGVIRTYAGTGTRGFSGDGGFPAAAEISFPSALTFDGAGNLYMGDGNNRIRRVSARSGRIVTFAGTGSTGQAADGIPTTQTRLGFNGAALAADSNGLYVATLYRVVKLEP